MSAHAHSHARPGGAPVEITAALTRRATYLSVGCATVLIVLKAVAWWASGSVAMLASLADSALDLVASLATFFAVRYAAAPPNQDYRYGHGKAEAFASLIQAGLVFSSAALVGREAVGRLLHPEAVTHETWAMAVMVISIVLTGALVTLQDRILRKAASVAVKGDRAHYAADLASNVAALVGIAGAAWMHWPWLDAVAGLVVAAWLVRGAIEVFRESSYQLLDRELADDERQTIRVIAAQDPRVRDVHQLRTRASGPFVHIQMHMGLDPDVSLEEAHTIVVEAERRLLDRYPAADVIIHADPDGRAEPHGGAFGEHL